MELKPKHLAPYLPYGLKAVKGVTRVDITAVSLDTNTTFIFHTTYLGSRRKEMSNIEKIKPILRPLSDLEYLILNQKQQELKTQEDTLIYWSSRNYINLDEICYNDIQWLLKNHFDIFGLIEQDLAIDINTI